MSTAFSRQAPIMQLMCTLQNTFGLTPHTVYLFNHILSLLSFIFNSNHFIYINIFKCMHYIFCRLFPKGASSTESMTITFLNDSNLLRRSWTVSPSPDEPSSKREHNKILSTNQRPSSTSLASSQEFSANPQLLLKLPR